MLVVIGFTPFLYIPLSIACIVQHISGSARFDACCTRCRRLRTPWHTPRISFWKGRYRDSCKLLLADRFQHNRYPMRCIAPCFSRYLLSSRRRRNGHMRLHNRGRHRCNFDSFHGTLGSFHLNEKCPIRLPTGHFTT